MRPRIVRVVSLLSGQTIFATGLCEVMGSYFLQPLNFQTYLVSLLKEVVLTLKHV